MKLIWWYYFFASFTKLKYICRRPRFRFLARHNLKYIVEKFFFFYRAIYIHRATNTDIDVDIDGRNVAICRLVLFTNSEMMRTYGGIVYMYVLILGKSHFLRSHGTQLVVKIMSTIIKLMLVVSKKFKKH